MTKENKYTANSDLKYIKSIMTRSEIGFKELTWFFLILAIYSFLSGMITSIFRHYIYKDEFQTGNIFRDVLVNTLLECGFKLLLLIPIIIVIFLFYKRVKAKNQGISLWLFRIISFVLIFCGIVLPIAVTAVCAAYEDADLFSILTCSICMLLCGIFIDSKTLKCITYVYIAIPMVILSILGITHLYYEYTNSENPFYQFVLVFSYTKSFFYVVYPAIGYAISSLFLKNKNKGMPNSEL